jgi:hypothetical protein
MTIPSTRYFISLSSIACLHLVPLFAQIAYIQVHHVYLGVAVVSAKSDRFEHASFELS